MDTTNVIVIGKSVALRGTYSASETYYSGNQVSMYGSVFQAISDNFSNIAPLSVATDGTVALANTSYWKCVIDMVSLYNREITTKSFVDKYGEDYMQACEANTELINEEIERAKEVEATKAEIVLEPKEYNGVIDYDITVEEAGYAGDVSTSEIYLSSTLKRFVVKKGSFLNVKYYDTWPETGYNTPPYGIYRDISKVSSVASSTTNGLMSAEDKAKLDGISSGANKTVVDSELSSTSTNPLQNKAIKEALDSKADTTVASTSANGLMSFQDKTNLDNALTDITNLKNTSAGKVTVLTGSDLDDVEQHGSFYITDVSAHCPDSSTVVYMQVMKTGTDFFIQTVWTKSGGVYTRTCVSNVFGGWKSL